MSGRGINEYDVIRRLVTALKGAQWGFNHRRCPSCAGWTGETETDHFHSDGCPIRNALKLGDDFLR